MAPGEMQQVLLTKKSFVGHEGVKTITVKTEEN
jgi:hypothetical protein